MAATLCAGLPGKSRTKMRMIGMTCDIETFLLACLYDKMSMLVWLQSEDGAKGRNRPKQIADTFMIKKERVKEIVGYASGEEFENARQAILRRINDGN